MSFKSALFASVAALVLMGAVASPAAADEEDGSTLSFEPSFDGTPNPPAGSELVESGTWQPGPWLPNENERAITGTYEGTVTYLYAYVGEEYNGQYLGVSLWGDNGQQITSCSKVQVYSGAANVYHISGFGNPIISRFGICYPGFEETPLHYEVYNKAE
jgi:hypothetical protein